MPSPTPPPSPGLRIRGATHGDWAALADVINRARRADGIDEIHTAESWAAEYPDSELFQLERDMLVAELDGRVVAEAAGYLAVRDGSLVAESFGAVVPEHRRRGIGGALYRATHERLSAAAAADPRPGPRERRGYAMDLEVSDRAILDANGYVPIRFGFEMRRYLTGALPEHPLPAGIELRPVTEDQYRAIWAADNEAFRDHWGHREMEEADFIARFHGPETDTSLWCVAWDGDEVVGLGAELRLRRGEREPRHLARLARPRVGPPRLARPGRRQGAVRGLVRGAPRRGMTEAWLGVDASNPTGALALYEGLGFHVVRRWQAFGRPMDGPAPDGWGPGTPETKDRWRSREPRVAPAGLPCTPAQRTAWTMEVRRRAASHAADHPSGPCSSCSSSSSPHAAPPARRPDRQHQRRRKHRRRAHPSVRRARHRPSGDIIGPAAPRRHPCRPHRSSSRPTAFPAGGEIPPQVHVRRRGRLAGPRVVGRAGRHRALVLVVDDPDARGFVHWIVYDMTGSDTGALPLGVSASPDAPPQGTNDFGRIGWAGRARRPASTATGSRSRRSPRRSPCPGRPTRASSQDALGSATVLGTRDARGPVPAPVAAQAEPLEREAAAPRRPARATAARGRSSSPARGPGAPASVVLEAGDRRSSDCDHLLRRGRRGGRPGPSRPEQRVAAEQEALVLGDRRQTEPSV